MADKEELKRAFKAFKKRLKLYQQDTGSSSPASHPSRDKATITAIKPPDQYPKEIWDELVEKGKLKNAGRGMYELNNWLKPPPGTPMDEIIVGINLFVACLALAYLEVQIEGQHGWAEKLPTWKLDTPWIRKLTNGKPITGYHVGMNAVILAFVHLPLAWNDWSWAFELRTLTYFFIIAVWWDFLWFLINPHYGIRRFKTENIWWHDKWILGIPKDYYVGTFVSVLCWLLADLATPGPAITLVTWCVVAGVVVGGTFATGLVVEVLRRTGDVLDEKAAEKLVPEEIEDHSPGRKAGE